MLSAPDVSVNNIHGTLIDFDICKYDFCEQKNDSNSQAKNIAIQMTNQKNAKKLDNEGGGVKI